MNILIVENSGKKAQDFSKFFTGLNHQYEQVFSVAAMRKKVARQPYDLVVIDLHIPETDAGQVDENGGFKVINYLKGTSDVIYRPQKMIVLSKYLTPEVVNRLNALGVMAIEYDSKDKWKNSLKNELEFMEVSSIKKVDILIITAVDIELEEARRIFECQSFDVIGDNSNYYSCEINNKNNENISIVICKAARMGPVASTFLTTKAIKMFKPECIIMVGIAGGNLKDTKIGDIVVAKSAVDYSSGSIEESNGKIEFLADPDMISVNDKIEKVFENYKQDHELLYRIRKECNMDGYDYDISMHLGLMASGPAVIKSKKFTDEFIMPHNRKYCAIDMETYGVYYSSKHLLKDGSIFVSIKSICDGANADKKDTDQRYCARIASILAKHFIMNDFSKII